MDRAQELALRPLHGDGLAVDLEVDSRRDRDRQASDAAHLSLSPDMCEDLAAEALALGVAAAHEARGCRYDRDPEPAEHARHLALARVDAEPRLADPAQPGDGGELAHVLHPQHELAGRRLLVRGDEALVAEDPRDLDAHPRDWHRDVLVARARGVADAREHVRDGAVRRAGAPGPPLLRGDRLSRRRRPLAALLPRGPAQRGQLPFVRHHPPEFGTPRSPPVKARSRKQMRQSPNFRMKARGRPHTWHRLWAWI